MTELRSQSDNTPAKILDAAYSLFSTQGYAGTSMRQIAKQSGFALGSIYNHFASKEDIFVAIIHERHPLVQLFPWFAKIEATTMDEFARIGASGMVKELETNPEFLNLLLIEMIEFKGKHAGSLLSKVQPDIVALSAKFNNFGKQIKPISPVLLIRVFVGTLISYFFTEMLLSDYINPEIKSNSLDTFIDVFLNGIKNDSNFRYTEGK